MAFRDRGLIIDSLGHNVFNTTTVTNVTCSASLAPSAGVGTSKLTLTQLGWSIRNLTAAAYTATISVRAASIAGTVLASWDVMPAANGFALDNFVTNIKGAQGQTLNVDFSPQAASVYMKLSIAGWEEKSVQT